MRDLTGDTQRLVDALVEARVAWQSPSELSQATGLGIEEVNDQLAELDLSGWLDVWEYDDRLVVTFSVVAASMLRLRLVDGGFDQDPRWARLSDPEPPGVRASGVFRDARAASLERVTDPLGSAEEAALRAEETLARHVIPSDTRIRPLLETLPRPTLLLGQGLTPWPGPAIGPGEVGPCPGCGSGRLGPQMYCLRCDRWGLDHLVEESRIRPYQPRSAEVADARRRDVERQARKARRQGRLLAQIEAEKIARRRRKFGG